MTGSSWRRLASVAGATGVVLVFALHANAADDRVASDNSSSASATVRAARPGAAPALTAGRSDSPAEATRLASRRGRVRGSVSIGYRSYRPYRASVSYGWPYYGWPYYGYYGMYGHYASWPYYVGRPYPVEIYGDDSARRPGAVETDVRPGRAELRIDGELAGQARDFNGTWDILWLEPGTHQLEFSRAGYQTLRVRIDVDAGSYYRIRQRLNKGEGLDPRSPDLTPAPAATQPEGREPRYRVPGNTPAPEDRSPGLERGFLTIEAMPADAAVYLDGRFLANAGELARLHGALPVAAGEHTVEVVRPGYRSVSKRVSVSADDTATVVISLKRGGGST